MSDKNAQYLIEYVTKLRQLNDINVEIPNVNIEEVIQDPEKYALDFVEAVVVANLPSYAKAYALGLDFGKKNK